MLYSPTHSRLVIAYIETYRTLGANFAYHLPPTSKAVAAHQQALLELRLYLDSIGVMMPILKRAETT